MKNTKEKAQVIKDIEEIDILEDKQELHSDLTVIDQAQHAKIKRTSDMKFVEKYLDGKEYDLDRITAEINAHIGIANLAFIEIGRRLLAVKQVEGHGKFIKWIENNFPGSQRTANKFMQLASKVEQRPELASLAKNGVSKALILLDMPDEYQEEFVEKGTIDGKPIDKYDTMSCRELKAEVNKLKNEQDKIIEEETKGLKSERDSLITENKRLKTFEPVEVVPEWSHEQAKELNSLALRMDRITRLIMTDDRLKDDVVTQAHIGIAIRLAEGTLHKLSMSFIDATTEEGY